MESIDTAMCAKHPQNDIADGDECWQCRIEREDRKSLFVVYILKGAIGSLLWQEAMQVPDRATGAKMSRHYLMDPNVFGVVMVRKSEMNRRRYFGIPTPIPEPK